MQIIFWVSFGILWVLVVIQSFVLLEILRQIGQLRKQVGDAGAMLIQSGVQAGESLPDVSGLRATDLRPAHWDDYLRSDMGVVVLLSTHCLTCREVARDLSKFAADIRKSISVVVVVEGALAEARAFVSHTRLNPDIVVLDEEGATTKRLGVRWTPAAVTVQGRKVGKAAVFNEVDQIEGLILEKETENVVP